MPKMYSLVLEIFWIREETALDGPAHPLRAAPAPPPSSTFSLVPASPQSPWWQQESGLASSAFVLAWSELQKESFTNHLYAPWTNKAALYFAAR